MAEVHRAVAANSEFRRPVALKRMLSHIAGSEEMVKSFVREARLASYLRHPNVAQTYDLGRVGDVYFIVMELITGRNLREVLRHCGATTGPMPVQIALNILNQICDALDYAHNLCDETGQPLGIIHRDVSPSNVIVSDSGVVKLIDFGIAKASAAGMQTLGGTLKGKFGYMAPEYLAGRIDARADLFAVGVIAHELLTNRPLFSGRDDIDTLTRVRDMRIDPPSRKNPLVPPEIDDVVMTALARDPERRWQHATALRSALTTLTQRLDLVATNTQVVQWLDWAFSHAARPRAKRPRARPAPQPQPQPPPDPEAEADTDTDAEALPVDQEVAPTLAPTVPLSLRSRDRSAISQKVTLVMADGDPEPPTKTPVGTPAYLPAQRSGAPPMPQTSAYTARVPSSSASPPIAAQPPRPASSSAPPPIAAPLPRPASPSAPPPIPSGHNAPPAPAVPILNAAPFSAPRPATPSQAPTIPYDRARSAMMQEFVQRASAASPRAAAPARTGHVAAVILIILAAVVAATTVYFVLPLLT